MIKPFSVRYGHVDVREHVQLNDLNSDTRMAGDAANLLI